MKKFILIMVAALALVPPALGGNGQGAAQPAKEYRIGPQDLLQIRVPDVAELANIEVRVSQDGTITAPYIGNLTVQGLTKDEIERRIAEVLSQKYVRNPQVTVFIKEYQNQQVSLVGAVTRSGLYEIIGRLNLLTLLSKAGGLTDGAGNEILIIREGRDGASTSIHIDLEDLMVNGNPKLNIPLLPNDVINVPLDRPIVIYVLGAVRNPGALQARLSQKITLLKAVAQAGGLGDSAKSLVTIKRTAKDGTEQQIKVNIRDVMKGKIPDPVLKEGDVLIVPESIF